MTHDLLLDVVGHGQQTLAVALGDFGDGYARHHGHHGGYVLFGYGVALALGFFFPVELGQFEVFDQALLLVAQLSGLFVALAFDHAVFLFLNGFDFSFELQDGLGHVDVRDVHAAACLVEHIDRFVGEVLVGDVAAAERDACLDGLVAVRHIVVRLVLVFDVVQDHDRLFGRGGVDHDLLEAALEGTVFFDVLTELVERSCADALNLATRQCGLKHVRRVKRSARATGTYDGVQLVDEQNHVGALLELGENGLHPLLKLAAVLRAGHERGDVEAHHALVEQHTAHLALHNAQS